MTHPKKRIDDKLLHDLSGLISNTNQTVQRALKMLGVFLPQSNNVNDGESVHKKNVELLHKDVEKLLGAENPEFQKSKYYRALKIEAQKLSKLNHRFGLEGPKRTIDVCAAIDAQLRGLTAEKIPVRKEHVRKLKQATFSAWHFAVMHDLMKLQTFGNELKKEFDSIDTEHRSFSAPSVPTWQRSENLWDMLTDIIETYRAHARTRNIGIRNKLGPLKAVNYPVDSEGIGLAFEQLLLNAIKYMGELSDFSDHDETWVKCTGTYSAGSIGIAVESWGVPLAPNETNPDILCADGYRGYHARMSDAEGTGRGLALVKKVMDRNDGTISIETIPVPKGRKFSNRSTVTFTLKFGEF